MVQWRSRRGLLELDLFLVPFAIEEYEHRSPQLRERFEALLEVDDMTLISWFRGDSPVDEAFADVVREVRDFRLSHPRHT